MRAQGRPFWRVCRHEPGGGVQCEARVRERIALGTGIAPSSAQAGSACNAAVWGASVEINDIGAPVGSQASAMRVTEGPGAPGRCTASAACVLSDSRRQTKARASSSGVWNRSGMGGLIVRPLQRCRGRTRARGNRHHGLRASRHNRGDPGRDRSSATNPPPDRRTGWCRLRNG